MYAVLKRQIEQRLKEKNMTIRDLENTLEKRGAIQNIISGLSKNPGVLLILKIAQSLECTIHELLEDFEYERKILSKRIQNKIEVLLHDNVEGSSSSLKDNYILQKKDSTVKIEHPDLLKECLNFVLDKMDPEQVNFKQIKNIAFEIYLYSLNQKVIDETFANWIIQKEFS